MLKTERMRQVVIAGAKRHQRSVIETLHGLKALHIEEHSGDDGFFGLGSPLPEGEEVAKSLLLGRGLQKALSLEDASATYALDDIQTAAARVTEIDQAISGLVDERAENEDAIRELEGEVLRLRRLRPLGLRVEELTGYTRVRAWLGSVNADPRPALAPLGERVGTFIAPDDQGFVALIIAPFDLADKVDAAMTDVAFAAIEAPTGEGPIEGAIGARTSSIGQRTERIRAIDAALAAHRDEHGPELLAAIETLEIAYEKAGAPVMFTAGPTSFVVSGYVPVSQTNETEQALLSATEHRIHLQWAEPEIGGHHGHGDDEHHEPEAADEPPVRFTHRNATTKSFTMLLGMHSLPRYRELDPTTLMAFTFPLFFGIMIGDVGFGILTALVAWYMRNNYVMGIGGPRVSRMLMAAGIWTFLFGLIFYGEAFGMHFVDAPGTLSWEWLFGADWSAMKPENVHSTAHAAETGADAGHGDGAHKAPHLVPFGFLQLGYFSKLHDVVTLLIISLIFAAVHLNVALSMGIRNAWVMHGAKHAILERVSWVILQVGVVGLGWGYVHDLSTYIQGGWGLVILAVVLLVMGEGAIAILELPKIFSNALSYTRLTAVALSKAGMTLAVTTFAFVEVDSHNWAVAGIGGVILIIVGFAIILALGILSGGLHAMRLQFVEFFGWFYQGGGRPFEAFGGKHRRSS